MRNKVLLVSFLFALACNLPVAAPAPTDTSTLVAPVESPTLVPQTAIPLAAPTLGPVEIVPVPSGEIQINGASYLAYQMPGDPFRFVCQQPCKGDPAVIYGQYAGFRRVREILIQLTGIDTLSELQPVDIHLTDDNKCSNLSEAQALSFAWYDLPGNAYTCTFLFEYRGVDGESYTPELASQIYNQAIMVHEYLHTVFFGRLPDTAGAMHDFVTPIAIYIAEQYQGDEAFCSYHPVTPPGDYDGRLIWELCRQNGFTLATFKSSLMELDALYQAGGGSVQQGFSHPTPSMAQYRDILNRLLGSDTRQAFADTCWPASLFGDNYQLSYACLYPTAEPTPTRVK